MNKTRKLARSRRRNRVSRKAVSPETASRRAREEKALQFHRDVFYRGMLPLILFVLLLGSSLPPALGQKATVQGNQILVVFPDGKGCSPASDVDKSVTIQKIAASPKQDRLAVVRLVGGESAVFLFSKSDPCKPELTFQGAATLDVSGIVWSPNNRFLAIEIIGSGGAKDVLVVDTEKKLATESLKRLARIDGAGLATWGEKGKKIKFFDASNPGRRFTWEVGKKKLKIG